MPHAFPLIKSKCVAADGVHTCSKPGHSCFRRVIDASQPLAKRGWRALSRGARGVLRLAGISLEVWDLRSARTALDDMLDGLTEPPTSTCCRCGVALGDCLQLVIADADQAFEACAAERLRQDWELVMAQYRLRTGASDILVRRGRADIFRAGHVGFGKGWWRFTLDHLTRSIIVFTALTLVSVCGCIFEMSGIPIGGLLSGVCVSVTLAAQEWRWLHDRAAQVEAGLRFGMGDPLAHIAWRRYVDDLIAVSRRYCRKCVFHFLRSALVVQLSPVTDLEGAGPCSGTWLDMDITVCGQSLCIVPKNVNRPWLYRGALRERCALGHWPGRPPKGFGNLRAMFLVRIARSRELRIDADAAAVWLGELVLEMFILGFPLSVLRALVHSLPCSPAAQAVRRLVRVFSISLRQSEAMPEADRGERAQKGRKGKRGDRGAEGDDWGRLRGPQRGPRGRDRRKGSRRSRSSSSSSSSQEPAGRRDRRVKKHQKFLYEHDPAYRAWKDELAAKTQEEHLRKQGQMLAEALGQKLDSVVASAASAASAAVQANSPGLAAPATPALAGPAGLFPHSPAGQAQVAPSPALPFPPTPPTPPKPCGAGEADDQAPFDDLRCKWLAAELGHKVRITPGTHDVVKRAILGKQSDRNLNNALVAFLRKYAPGVKPPRTFADKVDSVLECVRGQ